MVRDLRDELDGASLGDAADWQAIDAGLKTYRLLELAGSVQNRDAVLEQNAKLAAAGRARWPAQWLSIAVQAS